MNVGFFTALSGLQAAQRQLDTASHNVSNADTPGYSRQRVEQTESQPMGANGSFIAKAGAGMVGTGVTVTQIARIRDMFIDRQVRAESAPLGEANIKSDTLKQVEDVFGEPTDHGLSAQMQKFFDGWHDLANDPANDALRVNLRQQSVNLAAGFQEINGNLVALRQDVNDRIGTTCADINGMTRQIAQLNHEIKSAIAAGQRPNDLLDKQDLLIEQLSSKVQINVAESPSNGGRSVYINGQPLVSDEHQFDLQAVPTLLNGFFTVEYAPTGQGAQLAGGELKGLLDSRDLILSDTSATGYIKQINDLAAGLMASVNAIHMTGFGLRGITGETFFDGTDASDMVVNANILNDTQISRGLDVIAAAATDPGSVSSSAGVGDSSVAVAIAQLKNSKIMGGGTFSFDDYYKGVVTGLGVEAQEATRKASTQETLVASVKDRRDQVSGVSTDEEMANVVRFQKAYAASARILSTLSDMLDTLINLGK
ncbi:MAG: flagellar hook-associated protein FlgK [Cyanobacteria bacterium RYN_339]|nr:flagellar hook-associated protein FlgK [Cyanobacteria bacterium RYN_339]